MNKKPRLSFFGGVSDVTGARFLMEWDNKKILVDCGLNQGPSESIVNKAPFQFNPAEIDVLLITHAHLDHIGLVPKLVKDGFRGVIYSVDATKDLAYLMLQDAVSVLDDDPNLKNEPLYQKEDVETAFSLWKPVSYHSPTPLGNDIVATFFDAGHVLGSAMIKLEKDGKRILFTGDLGNSPMPLLKDTEDLPDVDYVVTESVYGDRFHEGLDIRKSELENVIENTIKNKGVLLVPIFSLERSQEILYELNDLVENHRLPKVQIFYDSPLGIKVTNVYQEYSHYFKDEARAKIKKGDDLFNFPGLMLTPKPADSKEIIQAVSPKIIMAGSGMSHGGRILHHHKNYLSDPNTTVLFVGFQSAGTLGRQIQEGAKRVFIHGEEVVVKAKSVMITGYSGHRDLKGLLDLFSPQARNIKKVFCVMGEAKSAQYFAQRLRDYVGINAIHPENNQYFDLW